MKQVNEAEVEFYNIFMMGNMVYNCSFISEQVLGLKTIGLGL